MGKERRELYIEGVAIHGGPESCVGVREGAGEALAGVRVDRKSTRLNSSHVKISYAVFCLKKKNIILCFFFFNDTATTEIYTLSLHDALPIHGGPESCVGVREGAGEALAGVR